MLRTKTREFIAFLYGNIDGPHGMKETKIHLISQNVSEALKNERKTKVDKDLLEAYQDVDDTNKEVYGPPFCDIIDGPNGICMKETKIPFDFYKMFSTL